MFHSLDCITQYLSTENTNPGARGGPPGSASSTKTSHRWKASRDEQLLMAIIMERFNGNVPKTSSDVKFLGLMMPVTEEGRVLDDEKLRMKANDIKKK